VEKTLARLGRIVREAVLSERVARQPGWLQGWEPRLKVASFLVMLAAATLLREAYLLGALGALTLIAAAASRAGIKALVGTGWWVASVFALALAAPAALSFFTPGEKVATLTRWPVEIALTRQGLEAALMLASRVTACALLMAVLVVTTRWQEMLGALRGLGVPSLLVLILGLTYRYLFLLLRLVEQTHYAKRSRTLRRGGAGQERAWAAGRIAALFSRSRRLSEGVYSAMLARGFTGRFRALDGRRPKAKDWLYAAGCAGLACLLVAGNRWSGV
jgi:cobalt/nickel transport system permease protein